MTQPNGHDHGDAKAASIGDNIEEIQALANQLQSPTVVERVPGDGSTPFEQATHTLMMESVDRVTQHWVAELNRVRQNTLVVEQMVIAQAAKLKDELTRLHLLGVQAMREAQRGNDVVQHLGDELDAMMTAQN